MASCFDFGRLDGEEVPLAFVVKSEGSAATEGTIMDFVADKVAPYKKVESYPHSIKIGQRKEMNHIFLAVLLFCCEICVTQYSFLNV